MYAEAEVGTVGLGQYSDYEQLRETLASEGPARSYVREKWADFLDLGRPIIDVQHQAALVAGDARQRGDMQSYEQARAIIRRLGELSVAHGRAIDTFNLERIGELVGLSGYHEGLGAIPLIAGGTVAVIGLAAVMAWAFATIGAEKQKLALVRDGVLTAAEYAQLDTGSSPGALLAGVGNLAKLALAGALAWFAFQLVQQYVPRGNPPLEVWHTNPPPELLGEAHDLSYQHADDGLDYIHEFGPGVDVEVLDDGDVHLSHRDGLPLWDDFEMEED